MKRKGGDRPVARLAAVALLVFAQAAHCEAAQGAFSRPTVERWVVAFFDAFNRELNEGDLDSWMSHWAEGAVRITPMGDAEGKAQIRALYADLLSRYRDLRHAIVATVIEGNRASVELHTVGTHRESGIEVHMPNVAILEFDANGKVTSARVYLDMKHVQDQLAGAARPAPP